jgi:hypothetical protein
MGVKAVSKLVWVVRGKVGLQAFFVGLIAFALLRLLAPPPTPYDYFSRLAQAFAAGRIHLSEAPAALNELIPAGPSRFYVPYPPFPAVILAPFVMLGLPLSQTALANFLGALNVSLGFMLAWLTGRKLIPAGSSSRETALLMALFLGLSTPNFFLASVGSAWYLAQVVATTCLLLAAISALQKCSLLAGVFLGAAYWSRLPVILNFPLLLLLLLENRPHLDRKAIFKITLRFGVGPALFICLNGLYNLVRFGVPWDVGYFLIPHVLAEPWYARGLFHPSYIGRHLEILFFRLPKKVAGFPYLIPSWSGMAIWLTTPAAALGLLVPPKTRLALTSWVSLFLTAVPSLFHGTTGFAQFGYRFALDSILPLFFLVYLGGRRSPRLLRWILVALGIVVNVWGTFLINRLGLVGW